jgi:hypothetical protein
LRSLVDHRFLIEVLALHGESLNGLLVDALEPPLAFEALLSLLLFLLYLDLGRPVALVSSLH